MGKGIFGGSGMKFMIKAFVLLLLFNALLIYMHYHESNHASAGNAGNTYNQEIEVINRQNELFIRHHFVNLPANRIEIAWPANSEQRTCHLSASNDCSRLDEHVTAFIEGESVSQSISYVIPKEQVMEESIYFKSVFATLHEMHIGSTVVHLTDEMHKGGLWVTGLKEIGRKSLELVDYTFFSGEGAVTDLYWQKENLPIVYTSEKLTIYDSDSNAHLKEIESAETVINLIGAPYSTIVYNKKGTVEANRFLITDQKDIHLNLEQLALNHFLTAYHIAKDEKFTAEVATSLMLSKEIGSAHAKEAFHVIQKYFTETELAQYKKAIRRFSGQVFNAKIMDELFEEVTGYRTTFFQKNNESADQKYQLLLEKPQDIIVADGSKLNKPSMIINGRVCYPIVEVMRSLGYDVSWNEQSLYIENASGKYRFPLNDEFYVFNERRYNVKSIPFEQIGEAFYFEESAMIRIFRFDIEKTSKVIEISPIAVQSEGIN